MTILSSPWPQLDDVSLGFHPGELILLAGQTKRGRTWVLLTMANAAAQALQDERVLIFPTTTPARDVHIRLYALRTKQSYNIVRQSAVDHLAEVGERDDRLRIMSFDPCKHSPTFEELTKRSGDGYAGLFVDDMMFACSRYKDYRRREIRYAAELKELAIRRSIPVIATVHSSNNGYAVPQGLSDHADVVLRLDPFNSLSQKPGPRKVIVDAARGFRSGFDISIKFDPAAGEYGGP